MEMFTGSQARVFGRDI